MAMPESLLSTADLPSSRLDGLPHLHRLSLGPQHPTSSPLQASPPAPRRTFHAQGEGHVVALGSHHWHTATASHAQQTHIQPILPAFHAFPASGTMSSDPLLAPQDPDSHLNASTLLDLLNQLQNGRLVEFEALVQRRKLTDRGYTDDVRARDTKAIWRWKVIEKERDAHGGKEAMLAYYRRQSGKDQPSANYVRDMLKARGKGLDAYAAKVSPEEYARFVHGKSLYQVWDELKAMPQ
jgi:hypothetical protein